MHSQAQKEAGFQADTVPGICLSVALQDIVAAPWGPGSLLLSMQGARLSREAFLIRVWAQQWWRWFSLLLTPSLGSAGCSVLAPLWA